MQRAAWLCLVLLLCSARLGAAAGNEPVNPLPDATQGSFNTRNQTFQRGELPAIVGRYVPRDWVRSGGVHGTASGMTSAAFATEAFTNAGSRVTADGLGGSASIAYASVGCATTDTAWVIISAATPNTLNQFQRAGTSNYFVDCTSTIQPSLPTDSAWLMKVTLTGGAITAVQNLAGHASYEALSGIIRAEDYGAVFVQGPKASITADDCGAAINAAIAAAPSTGGTIVLGRGACRVITPIVVSKPVTIQGHGSTRDPAFADDVSVTRLVKDPSLLTDVITVTANYASLRSFTLDATVSPSLHAGSNGIRVMANSVELARISVFNQQDSGIRVGSDSADCDCNSWVFTYINSSLNAAHGIYIKHQDSNGPNVNAGTLLHAVVQWNGGDGLLFQRAWFNMVYNLLAEHNQGYGLDFGLNASSNYVHGGDLEEANCVNGVTTACPTVGNLRFQAGSVANGVLGTFVFVTSVVDQTSGGQNNMWDAVVPTTGLRTAHGYTQLDFTGGFYGHFVNTTPSGSAPFTSLFDFYVNNDSPTSLDNAVMRITPDGVELGSTLYRAKSNTLVTGMRNGSGALAFGTIGGTSQNVSGVSVPGTDPTASVCQCTDVTSPTLPTGLVWNAYPATDQCFIRMTNITTSPIAVPTHTWKCVSLMFQGPP
jgi:hypothetical protein